MYSHSRRSSVSLAFASQSGACNLRVVLASLLFLGGASLAMFSFAMSVPSSTTGKAFSQTSPVIVTDFSDFQCPYCKRAADVVEQVRQTYGAQFGLKEGKMKGSVKRERMDEPFSFKQDD